MFFSFLRQFELRDSSTDPSPIPAQVINTSVTILVEDFKPRLFIGSTDENYFYNRLNGDRGALNNSILQWEDGQVKVTVSGGNTWGGIWESLNHPVSEGVPINFSAIFPGQISSNYQSRITGMTIRIAGGTPGRLFKMELKDGNALRWSSQVRLTGGPQVITNSLPPLETVNHLALVLEDAVAGNYVAIERISFTADTLITDTATAAFVWSYGMLLANWDPITGLVRDTAKTRSGEFDAIQSTGSLAAATALAGQLGVISHNDAVTIVSKIGDTLLNRVPKHEGLWPHWVKVPNGSIEILENTEWSSVDTVIAAFGLLDAQNALGVDTSGTEQMLKDINWGNLVTANGISHGYYYDGSLIPFQWDTFGGESWLAELGYAASTGSVAPLKYPVPPTANGSGFIDELAWLYVLPPSAKDFWDNDWNAYRAGAAENQITYYPSKNPSLVLEPVELVWFVGR